MNLNMDEIKEIMRKRLSLQHRGKNMLGSIALNEIMSYFKIKKPDPETENQVLTWYVRHNKIFLKTSDQNLKIQIFKEKFNIIKKINQKLSEVGYKIEIEDVILK